MRLVHPCLDTLYLASVRLWLRIYSFNAGHCACIDHSIWRQETARGIIRVKTSATAFALREVVATRPLL